MGKVGTFKQHVARSHPRAGRITLFALLLLVAGGFAFAAPAAVAVHDAGVFELDGNTANDPPQGDDWADVSGGGSSALSSTIVSDGPGGASIFDGGGSKDISPISDWKWKDANNVSQKTDLLHAGAALYQAPNGDPVVYLFADRRATNGDAKVGFWLFGSGVTAAADGTFNGTHSNGDLLLESDFTQGGANITNINVYEWQNGLTGPISTGANCGSAANDTECGINNSSTYAPPWGTSGATDGGAFFEGGVNLATLFGGQSNVPCFSSLIAESRSSGSSTSSILEDFVLGSFNTCGKITIIKDASPEDDTSFGYTTTGGSPLGGPFTLKDPSDNTKVFSDVKKGNYSVTENAPAAPWSFTGVDCTTSGGTTATQSGSTSTVNIALGYGGHVTCTYKNTFTKQSSTVSTDIHDGQHNVILSAPFGSTVHDKASVSGSVGTPTGTVDFAVYLGNTTCSGQGAAAGTVALVNGVADPSNNAVVPAGGLSFRGHYNGDGKYNAADGPCEPLTGTKVNPTVATDVHDAQHGVITSAPIGSTVHDKASVSGSAGTPTGSVSFTVYMGNTACSGQGAAAGTVALVNGVADPSSTAVVPAGGLSFRGHYNGDGVYNAFDGPCEPLTATKLNPTVTTDVHNTTHQIITSASIGATVHDKASVSGSQGTPNGSVSFTVYMGNTTCEGQGAAAGTVALVSGVADPSSTAVVPAGGLSFRGHYNGSATYSEMDGPCEPLTGTKLNPTVATDVHDAQHGVITSAPIGSTVHDKASVSGSAGTPTGTVDFTVWLGNSSCQGEGASAGSNVALNGSGIADPSNNATVPVGGLSFQAHYNGSATYSEMDGPCEPLTGTKLNPTVATDVHDAQHGVITSAPIGSTVHDKAGVSGSAGTPTGSVSFTVYMGNTACSGQGAAAGTVALVNGVADPSSTAVVPAGGLSFRGHYNGDGVYNAADGPCEPLTATKLNPTVTTDVHNTTHQIITSASIGATVHDKAGVSGSAGTPTGSVSFTVYMGNTACSGQGAAAGTVALVNGVADPSSTAVVPAGGLSFRGHYNGNATYNEADGPCEPLTGTKLNPTVATDVHDAQHGVITSAPIGSTVHDKASVSGSAGTPTGTVDFTVWLGNSSCQGEGASAGSNVALNGSGIADPSNNATVPVGGLSFQAHYDGDSVYNPADGPCEPLTGTKLNPTVATDVHDAQHGVITSAPIGSTVHDKAGVSGSAGTPTGSVSFTVYMGNTACSGQGAAAGTVALVNGVADPSSTAVVPAGGLSFRGHYNGDGVYNAADGPCEPLTALFGTIIVEKQTNPDGAAGSFAFTGDAAGTIGDGGLITVTNLAPGTYSSTEAVTADWTLTSITCNDTNSTGSVPNRTATFNLAAGETVKCTFTNAKNPPAGQGAIDVQKSASPTSLKEPGGPVTFSVTITNTSAVNVTITNVVDDKFGDLDDDGGNGCFDVPITLAPGEHVSCTFQKTITGAAGTSHIDTVTASGHDQYGNPVSDSDDARVDFTERLIDLVIVKEASSPTPLNGVVNYSLTVTNKGPDTATNVQLADPAPAGITYLTANPSQGTCSVSPSLITCSLGSIAAGQTVTIAITARATSVGSHTNTATVTGGGGRETNPADNVDSAVTVVPAPLKPPTVKPKPKPAPEYCLALTVSPKMITANGKPDKVTVKVTAGKKRVQGVKVSISGAGVSKTAKTSGKGVAVLRINPRKPGLITVTVVETNQKLCGPKRIGVVGVFLPPLTG